jgi:DNA-binding CsgD family transcriptional regulator
MVGPRMALELPLVASISVTLAHEHGCLARALATAASASPERSTTPPTPATPVFDEVLGAALAATGRVADGLEATERAHRAATSVGSGFMVGRCLSRRAAFLFELGRLDGARAEARAAIDLAEDLGAPLLSRWLALRVLAEAAVRQGAVDEAAAAIARLGPRPDCDVVGDECWAVAVCAYAQGRPGVAVAALGPLIGRLSANRFMFAARHPGALPQMVAIALKAGDREGAEAVAAAAAEVARRNPDVAPLQGVAAETRGRVAGDAGAARAAVELLAPGERPFVTAFARESLASLLQLRENGDSAIEELEAAYATYQCARAERDLARVRGALRALGVRKRQGTVARPAHGWGSLTAAELAVARVVTEGRTNREASEQLCLSPDTINTHLRHAFTKLGIRSRVELARAVMAHEGT